MIHPLGFEIRIGRLLAAAVSLMLAAAALTWLLRGRPVVALIDALLAIGASWLAVARSQREDAG